MSEAATKRASAGTVWIVIGAIGLLLALAQLITLPTAGDGASLAGKLFGMVLFGGLGAWALVIGIRRHNQASPSNTVPDSTGA